MSRSENQISSVPPGVTDDLSTSSLQPSHYSQRSCRRLNQESVPTWATLTLFHQRNVQCQSMAQLSSSTAMHITPLQQTRSPGIRTIWR